MIQKVVFPQKKQFPLKRTAAYARVSSGKDAMLHSLSSQVSYYNQLIQSNPEWLFCGVYADEALTGTKGNRAEFQKLLNRCRQGEIDLILTKSISRFARNTVTLLETVRELKSLGVDVYFEEQRIHSMSSDGELMLSILASYAQEESYSASENRKWQIRKDFSIGKIGSITILGYRRNAEDHTKQHANISLCFHRVEKNQKIRIILHLVEAMRDHLFLRIDLQYKCNTKKE